MFFIISSSSINKLLVELCRGTEENNESSRPTNKEKSKITNPRKSKDFQQFIEDGYIRTVTIETINRVYPFY